MLFFMLIHYQEYLPNLESNFTISYLPSIQIGLSLKNASTQQFLEQKLLSVEHPDSTSYSTLKFAKLGI